MAISKFTTTTSSSKPSTSGGSNLIIGILVVGLLCYGGYRFIYLPMKAKEEKRNG